MKKTKIMVAITATLLFMSFMAGCSGGDTQNEKNTQATTQTQATVSTDGSTSMEKVIGYLSEAYMEENKNVKVTYNPTGSGAGIQAVNEGRWDIGLSSRELKDDEAKTLKATVIAIDGIAVVVNPSNSVSDLSIDEISKIYTGEIDIWKDIGGNDGAIVVIGREASSGTRDGFEAITKTEDKCKYTQELTSTGDVIQMVASNPNAIGYASLASVKDSVKVVKVDGITPSKETVQDGTYKIQRNFIMVTKKDEKLGEEAQKFFEYVTNGNLDELIEKAGAIPVVK